LSFFYILIVIVIYLKFCLFLWSTVGLFDFVIVVSSSSFFFISNKCLSALHLWHVVWMFAASTSCITSKTFLIVQLFHTLNFFIQLLLRSCKEMAKCFRCFDRSFNISVGEFVLYTSAELNNQTYTEQILPRRYWRICQSSEST
jgi:hypothetical protein